MLHERSPLANESINGHLSLRLRAELLFAALLRGNKCVSFGSQLDTFQLYPKLKTLLDFWGVPILWSNPNS